jgi:hypothetical protein
MIFPQIDVAENDWMHRYEVRAHRFSAASSSVCWKTWRHVAEKTARNFSLQTAITTGEEEVAKTTNVASAADGDLSLSEYVRKFYRDILSSYELDAYVSKHGDVTVKTKADEDTAMEVKRK